MQYALEYLAVHRHTRLVTIDIDANDVFLCQETTADACASTAELQAVLKEIQANLKTIYTEIRDVARYHGHPRRDQAPAAVTRTLSAVIGCPAPLPGSANARLAPEEPGRDRATNVAAAGPGVWRWPSRSSPTSAHPDAP